MIFDAYQLFDGAINSAGSFYGRAASDFLDLGSNDSANVIDVSQLSFSSGSLGSDVGPGRPLHVICLVTQAFTGVGSTLQVILSTAPDNGTGGPGTWTALDETGVIPVASLCAGFQVAMEVPPGVQKFLKLTYVVGGALFTAGQIVSAILLDRQELGPGNAYPSGYSTAYF